MCVFESFVLLSCYCNPTFPNLSRVSQKWEIWRPSELVRRRRMPNSTARNQKDQLKPHCPEGRKNCFLPNGEKVTGQIFTCCVTFYYLFLPGHAMVVRLKLRKASVLINEATPVLCLGRSKSSVTESLRRHTSIFSLEVTMKIQLSNLLKELHWRKEKTPPEWEGESSTRRPAVSGAANT